MFIISLGGLSESGKSTAAIYLQSKGFCRIKIIDIENEIMIERGIIKKNEIAKEHHFDVLYENSENTFNEFIFKLRAKLDCSKASYATIESIYRPELSVFLKNILPNKYLCIYLEVPLKTRIEREYNRLIKDGSDKVKYCHVEKIVKEKDEFKVKHNAHRIKEIADYIVNNSHSLDSLLQKVDVILKENEVFIERSDC